MLISAFLNADWVGLVDDRRSTSGLQYSLDKIRCHEVLEKKPTVSRSSIEAEYKVVANTTTEIMWIQTLLNKIGIFSPRMPRLWCDNMGEKYLSANPVLHARTKHIEVDFHFVRERVLNNQL